MQAGSGSLENARCHQGGCSLGEQMSGEHP
jgi:hypothetical protein